MLELFNKYRNDGEITNALLVGKNMVNKNPNDYKFFEAYMDFLLYLAEKLPSLDDRKIYITRANIAFAFFEENADLSSDLISKLDGLRKRLENGLSDINKEESNRNASLLKDIEVKNRENIQEIFKLKDKLSQSKTQDDFDKVLNQIRIIDAKIDHDHLSAEQEAYYNEANKKCTDAISNKMRELERAENISYNKQAIASYENAFKKFSGDEAKYKNQTQLFSLVSKSLFAYDAAKLFNETLIYYNHIYSYIFNKLDDDGKFKLTEYSIECERKLR